MTTETAQATPAPLAIKDDAQLSDVIHSLATKRLALDEAEAKMKARVELIKKAFADATAEMSKELNDGLADVEAYAKANRARLYPVKKGVQAKTCTVLLHKLVFRSSSAVTAPAKAVPIIRTLILNLEVEIMRLQGLGEQRNVDAINSAVATILALQPLIRQPEPELNKEAVECVVDKPALELLKEHGIAVEESESFKVQFVTAPKTEEKAS